MNTAENVTIADKGGSRATAWLILSAVMSWFGLEQCLVSEADILDGMVASLH